MGTGERTQHGEEVRAVLRYLVTAIGRPTTFNVQQVGCDLLGCVIRLSSTPLAPSQLHAGGGKAR